MMKARTLKDIIIREIRETGPMDIGRYMALALGHPKFGYYMTRDPLGARGDFTTAPEISQVFGELIGAWLADMWLRAGAPAPFTLLECGPGRGTLMADLLRAMRGVPGFHAAARLCLLETSPVLRAVQEKTLIASGLVPASACRWIEDLADLPADRPLFGVANEFFDALPIRQIVRGTAPQVFEEMCVGLDLDGSLCYLRVPDANYPQDAVDLCAPGDVFEFSPVREQVMETLCRAITAENRGRGGAFLICDYGHDRTSPGDTLQAVRHHECVPVLAEPGEADITAHVDFDRLRKHAMTQGCYASRITPQGTFLKNCGIEARVAHLIKRCADDRQADLTVKAAQRLIASGPAGTGMGALFKLMAVTDGTVPVSGLE